MNHSFIGDKANKALCLKCKRDEISHSLYAQCEACPAKGPCDIVNNMLLCSTCFLKETLALRESLNKSGKVEQSTIPRIRENESNGIERLANKIQTNNIEASADYFNAEMESLPSLHDKFMNDESIPKDKREYAFAQHVVSMHEHLNKILFEAIDLQVQVMSQQKAHRMYLNGMANKLRSEERAALKITDIEYQPKQAPNKVKAVKQSPLESQAQNYARMLKIPYEQALSMVQSIVDANKVTTCTCASTPGLCKSHPSV